MKIILDRHIPYYREYFYNLHDIEVNQKYDKSGACLPYSFHLRMVEAQIEKFKHLIPSDKYIIVLIGGMGHDSIEDARLTFNDVKDNCGEEIAEIIYACTECRGKNRNERHSQEYYDYLK